MRKTAVGWLPFFFGGGVEYASLPNLLTVAVKGEDTNITLENVLPPRNIQQKGANKGTAGDVGMTFKQSPAHFTRHEASLRDHPLLALTNVRF